MPGRHGGQEFGRDGNIVNRNEVFSFEPQVVASAQSKSRDQGGSREVLADEIPINNKDSAMNEFFLYAVEAWAERMREVEARALVGRAEGEDGHL